MAWLSTQSRIGKVSTRRFYSSFRYRSKQARQKMFIEQSLPSQYDTDTIKCCLQVDGNPPEI